MVSTDGHRLAFEEKRLALWALSKGVILPRKGLAELRKLLESGDQGVVSIGFKENMALISKDNVEFFMRLIDGDFPDYTKVIPKGNPNLAKIDHDELLQALRRVSISVQRTLQRRQDGIFPEHHLNLGEQSRFG